MLKGRVKERFWSKVTKTSTCWLWVGGVAHNGYGRFWVHSTTICASRVSWELHYGPIPEGLLVCHKCDNKACVNPLHLFLGSQKQNMEDCISKGRTAKGIRNGKGKLTDEQIIAIRRSGLSKRELSRLYPVHYSTIWAIKSNITHKEAMGA